MGKLLDLLNTANPVAVALRIDILQTILGVFQLDNSRKALFRDGCGFHYLISVLTSLYGSLGPYRGSPWIDSKYNTYMCVYQAWGQIHSIVHVFKYKCKYLVNINYKCKYKYFMYKCIQIQMQIL